MFAIVVSIVIGVSGVTDQDIIDAIVKAQIELAKVDPYAIARERAIKENKPLLVLVGGSEVKQCTDVGCKPLPSSWILLRVHTFDLGKGVIKSGIIISRPSNGDLFYLDTVANGTYVDQVANVITPVVAKGHWVNCPLCPGGRRWVPD